MNKEIAKTIRTFCTQMKINKTLAEFLVCVGELIDEIFVYIGKVLSIVILAYPLRYFWNVLSEVQGWLPPLTHIDHAIAVLAIVGILGWVFKKR